MPTGIDDLYASQPHDELGARRVTREAMGMEQRTLVLNAISPSVGERRIWVPVTATMLVCSLVVALAPAAD